METKSKHLLRSLRGFNPALADSLGPKLDERQCKAEFHAVAARLDLVLPPSWLWWSCFSYSSVSSYDPAE
jgi:hypothetical protein